MIVKMLSTVTFNCQIRYLFITKMKFSPKVGSRLLGHSCGQKCIITFLYKLDIVYECLNFKYVEQIGRNQKWKDYSDCLLDVFNNTVHLCFQNNCAFVSRKLFLQTMHRLNLRTFVPILQKGNASVRLRILQSMIGITKRQSIIRMRVPTLVNFYTRKFN